MSQLMLRQSSKEKQTATKSSNNSGADRELGLQNDQKVALLGRRGCDLADDANVPLAEQGCGADTFQKVSVRVGELLVLFMVLCVNNNEVVLRRNRRQNGGVFEVPRSLAEQVHGAHHI